MTGLPLPWDHLETAHELLRDAERHNPDSVPRAAEMVSDAEQRMACLGVLLLHYAIQRQPAALHQAIQTVFEGDRLAMETVLEDNRKVRRLERDVLAKLDTAMTRVIELEREVDRLRDMVTYQDVRPVPRPKLVGA